jgi:hypothetical protein
MTDQLRRLEVTEEVMVKSSAVDASRLGFNPYYGLVVHDDYLDPEPNRTVTILWEDGLERMFPRNVVFSWRDLEKELKSS